MTKLVKIRKANEQTNKDEKVSSDRKIFLSLSLNMNFNHMVAPYQALPRLTMIEFSKESLFKRSSSV